MNWEVFVSFAFFCKHNGTALHKTEEECELNGVIFPSRNTFVQSLCYLESFDFFISD